MSSEESGPSRLRILHGGYWHVTACIGYVNELANRHEVMFITTRRAVQWLADESWRELFNPRIHLRVESPISRARPRSYLDRAVGLWRGVHGFRPDVVHVQEVADSWLNYLLLQVKRTPLVMTVHDPVPHAGEEDWFLRYYEKRKARLFALRRRADWIITHGHEVREELLRVQPELDPERVAVVLHGAMNHLRHFVKPDYAERPGTVLFFGRIKEYKGLGVLVEAWEQVSKACPNAKVIIAGRGPDLDNYRARILADPSYELIDGLIPSQEMVRLFAKASIVVLPYTEATQSGPLAIAVALGKPVIATEVGGLPDMVDKDESGLVIPPRSPDALADALIRLLKDDALRARLAAGAERLSRGRMGEAELAVQNEMVYRKAIEFHRSVNR